MKFTGSHHPEESRLGSMVEWAFRFFHFVLCVWMFCVHACLFTMCVLGALGGQKRVSDPPELEL